MRKLINCLSLGAVVLLASCEKGTEYQPAPFGAPAAVTGVVIATDEFQNPLPDSQQPSVQVTLSPVGEGGEASGSAQGGTVFRIGDVRGGTYNVSYRADGFRELVRPNLNHGGGSETRIDTTYLVQESTTTFTDLQVRPKIDIQKISYSDDVPVFAGNNFNLSAGDSIMFFIRLAGNLTDTLYVIPRQDTVLTFSKDTILYKPRITILTTTTLVAKLKLTTPSTVDALRGALLVISNSDNPTAENYQMIQTALQTKPRNVNDFSDSLVLNIPLTSLEQAGIVSGSNRRVYVAAYGLSGRFFAYGATLSPDRLFYIYPTHNPNRTDVKFVDL